MNFRTPIPFAEAIDSRQVRTILPTEFRTALLQEIPAKLRERAMFSAGVTNAEFLQDASDRIDALVAGTSDRATQRAGLKQLLSDLQYRPAQGEEGTLTDLSSDARLNLILDTNTQMAFGYGQWKQGQDPAILDMWPAQELVRIRNSRVPRDWEQRWRDAGGEVLPGGRMVALKNDPIWTRISRFGLPYPPFDFNSGMDVQDVDRTEAVALGLIDRDTELLPQDRGLNDDLQAEPEVRAGDLQEQLLESLREEGLNVEFADGVLRFLGRILRVSNSAGGYDPGQPRDDRGRWTADGAAARGLASLQRAMKDDVDVFDAMDRPEFGPVDFRQGNDHFGLRHIRKRAIERSARFGGPSADDVLQRMPGVIARGQIRDAGSRKLVIEHDGYRAVLGKDFKRQPANHWLLTGYDIDESKNKRGSR